MLFHDIVGHEDVKKQLLNTVKENRVSHAQLFLGPEGSGSLALALAYAQYINCENKQATDSCGDCGSCRKHGKLIHPDLHFSYPFFAREGSDIATAFMEQWRKAFLELPYLNMDYWRSQLDGANKQANINIKEAQRIIKALSLKAFEAEYKILIMWLPEYLEKEGNALLKLIEEPPAKTIFLLVAENQDKILNTIISRTQLVKINRLRDADVSEYLVQKAGLAPEHAAEIAFISEGNIPQAMSLLGSDAHSHFDLFIRWMRFCVTDSGLSIINLSDNELSKLGRENQKSFLLYAINMMRQILLVHVGLVDIVHLQAQELDFARKFGQHYQLEQIEGAIRLFEEAHYHIERNANPKILFLDLSLQLVLIYKYSTIRRKVDTI